MPWIRWYRTLDRSLRFDKRELKFMKSDPKIGFKEIEHTADKALKIFGQDLRELLLNAARGMNSLMAADVDQRARQVKKHVQMEALDTESLLVEWLSELAFWAETEMLVFTQFDFRTLTPVRIQATLIGAKAQSMEKHIKAVTYHNLRIEKTDTGLETTIVFDV